MKKLGCFSKNNQNLNNEQNRPVQEKLLISDKSYFFIH